MVYVSVTDLFYTNWKYGKNKIVKIVFMCDTWEEAKILANNQKLRQDRKDVKITFRRPKYKSKNYLIDLRGKINKWFAEGDFMEEEKPVAIMYCGNAFYSLELYKIEYGIDDYVIVKFSDEKKKRRLKIYYTDDEKGGDYFKINGVKYYMNEFMRL